MAELNISDNGYSTMNFHKIAECIVIEVKDKFDVVGYCLNKEQAQQIIDHLKGQFKL